MPGIDLLLTNLLQPIVLAFLLGAIAGFVRSELAWQHHSQRLVKTGCGRSTPSA